MWSGRCHGYQCSAVGICLEVLPSPASLEELEKEDQLAFASDGNLIISLGMKAPTGSVHWPSPSKGF